MSFSDFFNKLKEKFPRCFMYEEVSQVIKRKEIGFLWNFGLIVISNALYWPKRKTIIPARSECLIQGVPEVSGQFRYAVTDFLGQISQKGVLVAATHVYLKREAIPVRVLNLDNKPMTVDKGAVIATCEPVVDIVARYQKFSESLHLPSIFENLEELNEE
ncbi:hypothetical protein AVEN_121403-1 [Araneus ventricosus]|uniref:Uncharacterized protein n=1 Tax=Araneus ventricosus TaxID=182803 RepID=A0A4Y2CPP1_ARAVE|nr:hypothetical protein AVEN_121403-1 [Araneus ventricosus]